MDKIVTKLFPDRRGHEPDTVRAIAEMFKAAKPTVTIAGVPLPPREGRTVPKRLGEDPELLAKTAHVRKRGEKLMQLIARCGISPVQIREWSTQRIAEFCETVSQNEDYVLSPDRFNSPAPTKFYFNL